MDEELIELPGYVFVPASVVDDVRSSGRPICARSMGKLLQNGPIPGNMDGDWWIVFRDDRDNGIVTTMPEAEWDQLYPPVLRAWISDQGIIYATAE